MAARRMITTRFFKDPDIMSLSSKDTQLILIGLVLAADDEGREVAHAGILGREMDYSTEQMEAALQELATSELLVLYQVGKHRYYQLMDTVRGWQTLGGRITPSRYPAPPSEVPVSEVSPDDVRNDRGKVGEKSGKSRGKAQNFPRQFNRTEDNRTEEGGMHSSKVVPFPRSLEPGSNDNADDDDNSSPDSQSHELTQHIARILQLPVTGALVRLVIEYTDITDLSLSGEADAAREWIDDPRRNKKHRTMSPAFFRNWLKREQEANQRRRITFQQVTQATGTSDPTPLLQGASRGGGRPTDLMHLADEDQSIERAKGEKQ